MLKQIFDTVVCSLGTFKLIKNVKGGQRSVYFDVLFTSGLSYSQPYLYCPSDRVGQPLSLLPLSLIVNLQRYHLLCDCRNHPSYEPCVPPVASTPVFKVSMFGFPDRGIGPWRARNFLDHANDHNCYLGSAHQSVLSSTTSTHPPECSFQSPPYPNAPQARHPVIRTQHEPGIVLGLAGVGFGLRQPDLRPL